MAVSLVVLIFFSVLGVLMVLYTMHFRRRALSMDPQRLHDALSRTVSGEDEASVDELREGASELEARLQRALYAVSSILILVLVVCLVLTAASTLSELVLALSGFCILLACAVLSIMLLRDIPRYIRKQLDKEISRGL
jgi:hypothetical protein